MYPVAAKARLSVVVKEGIIFLPLSNTLFGLLKRRFIMTNDQLL